MKIVILGGGGQLAHDLERAMTDWDVIPLSRAALDICDSVRVSEVLGQIHPAVVINTAAFHRVDDCEEQLERAFQVNAFAVGYLAKVCANLDSTLLHISTDYVFDGQKKTPYTEEDYAIPVNVYGLSKLVGEYFAQNLNPKHIIVRTSGLYGVAGSNGKGNNFVETIIRMADEDRSITVVEDQIMAPTSSRELALKLFEMIEVSQYGLFHLTNRGECSWYEFAVEIIRISGRKPDIAPISSEAYNSKARRPEYSVLSNHKHSELGLDPMRSWEDAAHEYLKERGIAR